MFAIERGICQTDISHSVSIRSIGYCDTYALYRLCRITERVGSFVYDDVRVAHYQTCSGVFKCENLSLCADW